MVTMKNDLDAFENSRESARVKNQVGQIDEVTIHVCDEVRKASKYFFCQRNLLVHHMKYFERFLAENESNRDLDISVHCDIEIFDWLMNYIHDPSDKPKLDKSIVISILISSEFLQMESLVDICLKSIASRLNEIIKLPIDLSCISDKLVNQLALLTDPKILSQTKDRKDKILNRLYKRRVEIDFSRRGGMRSTIGSSSNRHCGMVYLEKFVSSLSCKNSTPSISFRGNIVRRHTSILGWSLTSYLKTLHTMMNWETIYWHVWAACIILQPNVSEGNKYTSVDMMISAIEVDRYSFGNDGLLIFRRINHKDATSNEKNVSSYDSSLRGNKGESEGEKEKVHKNWNNQKFSLSNENENLSYDIKSNMVIFKDSFPSSSQDFNHDIGISQGLLTFTSTLNPCRSPEILTPEIFELLSSQAKLIAGIDHIKVLENTPNTTVGETSSIASSQIGISHLDRNKQQISCNIGEQLWSDSDARTKALKGSKGSRYDDSVRIPIESTDTNKDGRRSRSASRNGKAPSRNTSRPKVGGVGTHVPISSRNRPSPSVDSRDSDPDLSLEQMRQKVTDKTVLQKKRSSKTLSSRTSNLNLSRQVSSSPKDAPLSSNMDDLGEDKFRIRESLQLQAQQPPHSLDVLTALPTEIVRSVEENGVVRGMWLTSHPLEVQPLSFIEAFQAVEVGKHGQAPSAEKQSTWQLDLLREYDDQRMERYGSFLTTKRNPSIEDQLKAMAIGVGSSNLIQQGQNKSTARKKSHEKSQVSNEYYKDKGRQCNR